MGTFLSFPFLPFFTNNDTYFLQALRTDTYTFRTVVLAPVISTPIKTVRNILKHKTSIHLCSCGCSHDEFVREYVVFQGLGTSKSLWDHNVNVQPENAFALNNLASTMWQEGNKEPEVFDRVMQLYRKSLLYDSSNIDTLCNVATF